MVRSAIGRGLARIGRSLRGGKGDDAVEVTTKIPDEIEDANKIDELKFNIEGAAPRAAQDSGNVSKLGRATKFAGVTGASYAGVKGVEAFSKRQDRLAQQQQSEVYDEYLKRREQVLNNGGLTPEQKQERLKLLQEGLQGINGQGGGGGGGGLGALFDGLGTIEMLSALVVLIIVYQVVSS